MTPTRPAPAALALLALLLAPAAQAGADCTEADSCVLRVTLDGSGLWFDAPGDRDATVLQHRWYTLDVLNQFDEEHALTLGNQTLAAPGYDGDGPRSRHGPIQFPQAGDLVLRDATARTTATVHVEAAEPPEPPPPPQDTDTDPPGDGDAQDPPTGSSNEDGPPPERRKDVPGPSPPLVAAATAAAALAALAARDARSRR